MRIDLCVAASLLLASGAALALDDTPTQSMFQPRLEERAPLRQRGDAALAAAPQPARRAEMMRPAARTAGPAPAEQRAAPPPWHAERLRSLAEKTSRHLP